MLQQIVNLYFSGISGIVIHENKQTSLHLANFLKWRTPKIKALIICQTQSSLITYFTTWTTDLKFNAEDISIYRGFPQKLCNVQTSVHLTTVDDIIKDDNCNHKNGILAECWDIVIWDKINHLPYSEQAYLNVFAKIPRAFNVGISTTRLYDLNPQVLRSITHIIQYHVPKQLTDPELQVLAKHFWFQQTPGVDDIINFIKQHPTDFFVILGDNDSQAQHFFDLLISQQMSCGMYTEELYDGSRNLERFAVEEFQTIIVSRKAKGHEQIIFTHWLITLNSWQRPSIREVKCELQIMLNTNQAHYPEKKRRRSAYTTPTNVEFETSLGDINRMVNTSTQGNFKILKVKLKISKNMLVCADPQNKSLTWTFPSSSRTNKPSKFRLPFVFFG
jgi:hypothetical protein